MYYLLWHDDRKKMPITEKIAGAIQAFTERFQVRPTLILVNEMEQVDIPGIRVEVGASIPPGDFWLGPVEGVWL